MTPSASLPALRAAYDRCVAYAERTRDAGIDTHLSDFWREILGARVNYPSFDDMLVMRRGFTYPIADRAKAEDLEAERAYARAAWDVVGRTVPETYFHRFDESAVGAPTSFSFAGRALTAGGIVNALTSYRILAATERLGLAGRSLRVLEIGAGYGQVAHQLLQQLDIASYVVCDLPENAFLTAFYLQANHPARTATFVPDSGAADDAPAGLVFTIPPYLHELEGEFDVIINSYSFQEMRLDSVREYVAFAAERLSPAGFVYSLNAHAKAGVERPSGYDIECFELETLACPRRYPWQPNGTVPYELVMRPRAAPALSGERLARRRDQLDGLGGAMQLGLSDELAPLLERFVDGEEGAADAGLDALASAFRGDTDQRRRAVERVGGSVGTYLAGVLAFVAGDDVVARPVLRSALDSLPDTHARVWALTVLASLVSAAGEHREATAYASQAARIAPHLAGDVARLVGAPDTARAMLASRAGCAPPSAQRSDRKPPTE
ncbi:MAG TPA: putative sugar O-methyltransferase [Solirubrobacteraceae bacterium]